MTKTRPGKGTTKTTTAPAADAAPIRNEVAEAIAIGLADLATAVHELAEAVATMPKGSGHEGEY